MKAFSLVPFLVLAACGSNAPSKQDAARIYSAADVAMTNARTQAVSQAQGVAAPMDLMLNYTGACSMGGTVALAGSYSDNATTQQATFDLSTTFTACHEVGGTIDGDVHWTASLGGTGVTSEVTGNLDWDDGSNTASCTLDLHLAVGATGVTYTGTVCGYDVTQLSLMP